jgi:hypothetical protein
MEKAGSNSLKGIQHTAVAVSNDFSLVVIGCS